MARRTSEPMTVTLPPAQKAFVEACVRDGRYASASEVVRAGLRALEREEVHLQDWADTRVLDVLSEIEGDALRPPGFAEAGAATVDDGWLDPPPEWMVRAVRAALDDPRPSIPADELEARLRARMAAATGYGD